MAGSDVKAKYIAADTNAADATSVCTAEQLSGGGEQAIPIDGTDASGGVATFTAARKLTVTASAADSARTVTITGTDVNGNVQTEAIGVTDSGVSTGTLYFRTVTAVVVDNDTVGTLSVGMANDALDVIYAGRVRLRGIYLIHSGSAGVLSFRDGSATGTAHLQLATVASAGSDRDIIIPDEGVMYDSGIYLPYTAGTTVFSSFTAMYN
jgi:hypothetical protein